VSVVSASVELREKQESSEDLVMKRTEQLHQDGQDTFMLIPREQSCRYTPVQCPCSINSTHTSPAHYKHSVPLVQTHSFIQLSQSISHVKCKSLATSKMLKMSSWSLKSAGKFYSVSPTQTQLEYVGHSG